MSITQYQEFANKSMQGNALEDNEAKNLLISDDIELLPLLQAAYEVRKHYFQNKVTIHIINNAQNGHCQEDCHYCAQAKTSKAEIEEYPLKSDDEFLAEARNAYKNGAHRYCMVFAGRGPSKGRVEKLANLIQKIKSKYPLEICVSAGLLDKEKAKVLKRAGLDRLNHNLNTSEKHYDKICTTHTYQDRLQTLTAAKSAGIQLCSGVIVGMNEQIDDIIEVAYSLRKLKAASIPVNFLIPIEGNPLDKEPDLTPKFCLRVLCLFRFLNPEAEIRIAAGREYHLRSLESLALYPANSLFLNGYLNAKGESRLRTLQMIKDAGFEIESDCDLDELIGNEQLAQDILGSDPANQTMMKDIADLRPEMAAAPKSS